MFRNASIALLVLAPPIAAQAGLEKGHEFAAFSAITQTPAGALPQLVSGTIAGDTLGERRVTAIFGHVGLGSGFNWNTYGISASTGLVRGAADLRLTVGYVGPSCPNFLALSTGDVVPVRCFGAAMAGLGGTVRLAALHWVDWDEESAHESAPGLITVSLDGSAGVAVPHDYRHDNAQSAVIGVPVALSRQGQRAIVTGFVSPQLGWGHTRFISSETRDLNGALVSRTFFDDYGFGFILAGGIGIRDAATGLGIAITGTNIFVNGSQPQVGVGVSWGTARH